MASTQEQKKDAADTAGASAPPGTRGSRNSDRRPSRLIRRQIRADWAFLAPALIILVVFKLIPTLSIFYISMTEWNILGDPEFTGLTHFVAMWDDPRFIQSLTNTGYYIAVIMPALTFGSLGVALLTERLGSRGSWFRLIYFLPIVIPFTLNAAVWKSGVFSPFGFVNQIMVRLGFERVAFLGIDLAKLSVSSVIIWAQFGLFSLFFLAGLKAIPEEVLEAAKVDGANTWQRFAHITFPLLRPTTLLVMIVSTVAAFRAFDVVYVLTGGGPNYASTSILIYLYEMGWQRFQMGYAGAIAVVAVALVLLLSVLQRVLIRENKVES